jgi:HD superfamily phosphohydrolase
MTPAPARGKGPRPRLVRDPIHGDIAISALEAAVIDTRVFQRLRYLRQDGLLHFIFPGAVHTRFAHSIGTMAVAERVLSHLLAPVEPAAG